jgi:hypothetical protein
MHDFGAGAPAMSPQAFSLTGFERINGVDYAQSWLVMPAK